jgi:cephalosporin hydroxylase
MITNPRLFGIPIAQRWDQLAVLFEDIETYKVNVVVEIGLFCGGLADLFLIRQQLVPDFHYFGVEFDPSFLAPRLRGRPEIMIRDAFDSNTVSMVQSKIAQYKTALIYCDDGNKPKEMNTYALILRVGDLLMVHDVTTEVTFDDLDNFGRDFSSLEELEPNDHRGVCMSLWRRFY